MYQVNAMMMMMMYNFRVEKESLGREDSLHFHLVLS